MAISPMNERGYLVAARLPEYEEADPELLRQVLRTYVFLWRGPVLKWLDEAVTRSDEAQRALATMVTKRLDNRESAKLRSLAAQIGKGPTYLDEQEPLLDGIEGHMQLPPFAPAIIADIYTTGMHVSPWMQCASERLGYNGLEFFQLDRREDSRLLEAAAATELQTCGDLGKVPQVLRLITRLWEIVLQLKAKTA